MTLDSSYWESDEYKAKEKAQEEWVAKQRAKAKASFPGDKLAQAIKWGVPERAAEIVLSDARFATEASKAVDGATDMLVLSGSPGCGKTVAAALWVTTEIRDDANWNISDRIGGIFENYGNSFHGKLCVWTTAAKLARWERYDDEQMQKLLRTAKLVIDDLGGEYLDKGGFYASLLDEIINERQAASRPTVMTTNLDATAFSARYGERIIDRIREGGRFFACGNKSLRRKESPT